MGCFRFENNRPSLPKAARAVAPSSSKSDNRPYLFRYGTRSRPSNCQLAPILFHGFILPYSHSLFRLTMFLFVAFWAECCTIFRSSAPTILLRLHMMALSLVCWCWFAWLVLVRLHIVAAGLTLVPVSCVNLLLASRGKVLDRHYPWISYRRQSASYFPTQNSGSKSFPMNAPRMAGVLERTFATLGDSYLKD